MMPSRNQKQTWQRAWRSDRGFMVLLIAIQLGLTSLPYLYAYLRTPRGKQFMGIMLDVPDTTQYWAWMESFRHNWLIANPLTPERNDPIYFNLLWFVLGRLQSAIGTDQAMIYQGFRLAAILFFGVMAWHFCRSILATPLSQRTAFALIMFGSGLGWLAIAAKQLTGMLDNPLAVFVAEPNTFVSALAYPHLIFSVGLMLGIFTAVLRSMEHRTIGPALLASLLALVLGLEHTYDLIIVYGVLGGYWLLCLWQQRRIDWLHTLVVALVGGLSALPSAYFVLLTATNPTWKGVLAQYGNAGVFTPDPLNLLILIGPLLILAAIGCIWACYRANVAEAPVHTPMRLRFVQVWFVVNALLLYIPTNFQIKMLNGWQVPICLLATIALLGPVAGWVRGQWPRVRRVELALCVLTVLVVLPTTIYFVAWRFVDLNRVSAPYYLERDEVAALDWLRDNTPQSAIVLSTEDLGQYIVPVAVRRPFLAHWAMTLDYYTKRKLAAEVLDPQTSPSQREAILKQYSVGFVLYDKAQRDGTPPLSDPSLHKVFSSPSADIYETIPNPQP